MYANSIQGIEFVNLNSYLLLNADDSNKCNVLSIF